MVMSENRAYPCNAKTTGPANGGNSREEYFIEGTQPTQQAVHEVGTTIIDNGEAQELF
jgi:hypothetical protein